MPSIRAAADAAALLRFGAGLRRTREGAGLTQAQLGERADLHVTYISGIERGQRNVSLLNLLALAAAMEIAPSALLACMDGSPGERGPVGKQPPQFGV